MTEFDKVLIEKAKKVNVYNAHHIEVFKSIADTDEAREQLNEIRWKLYDRIYEIPQNNNHD